MRYARAGSAAEREALHQQAEALRRSYGGYGGGRDGSGYVTQTPLSARIRAQTEALGSYGSFRYPEEEAYRKALREVTEREPFAYDMEADPLYRQYAEQYRREGRRATEDTLGKVSARTGGLASSYAAMAARQAGDRYLQKLNDAALRLYQQAYSRYRQELQEKLDGAMKTQADTKTAAPDGTADGIKDYQRETKYGEILNEIRAHLTELYDEKPVVRINGDEFQKTADDNRNLRSKVIEYFNSLYCRTSFGRKSQ